MLQNLQHVINSELMRVGSEQSSPHGNVDISVDIIRDGHIRIRELRRIRQELEDIFTCYLPPQSKPCTSALTNSD